jgi:hypothetical protein
LALVALPALAIAEPGDMMHMTASIQMQISSTKVNIPPQSFSKDICVSKQHDARDIVTQSQRNKTCVVSDYKFAGTSGTFRYVCSGEMQLQGDGSFQIKSGGGSHVAINTSGNVHGQPMSMSLTFEATPSGASCDYTPPAAPQPAASQ